MARPLPDPDPIVVLTIHLVPGTDGLAVIVAADHGAPPGLAAFHVNDALGALVASGELTTELDRHWTATRAATN